MRDPREQPRPGARGERRLRRLLPGGSPGPAHPPHPLAPAAATAGLRASPKNQLGAGPRALPGAVAGPGGRRSIPAAPVPGIPAPRILGKSPLAGGRAHHNLGFSAGKKGRLPVLHPSLGSGAGTSPPAARCSLAGRGAAGAGDPGQEKGGPKCVCPVRGDGVLALLPLLGHL